MKLAKGLRDSVIDRFLATVPPEHLGDICSVTRNEYGLCVAWVWLPQKVLIEWEGKPVFNVQVGKYAFSDHDQPEPEPECDAPF